LLAELGALDGDGRITPRGENCDICPLPPRLARMWSMPASHGGGRARREIALVLTSPARRKDSASASASKGSPATARPCACARAMAKRMGRIAHSNPSQGKGGTSSRQAGGRSEARRRLAARACYPDRVAKNRGAGGSFLLANGRGARVDAASARRASRSSRFAEIAALPRKAASCWRSAEPCRNRGVVCRTIEKPRRGRLRRDQRGVRARSLRSLGAIVLASNHAGHCKR